jgi:hypothetical protein
MRFTKAATRTRDSFKNSRYTLVLTDEALGVELYEHRTDSKTYVMAFSGKRQRPDFHFSFGSHDYAQKYAADWLAGIDRKQAERAAQKARAKAEAIPLQVGDVLRSMWGYDQTNVDFYEVVELVGKCSVRIREIAAQREAGDMRGLVVPKLGAYIGEPMLKRVSDGGRVKLTSFSGASLFKPLAVVDGVRIYPPTEYTSYA